MRYLNVNENYVCSIFPSDAGKKIICRLGCVCTVCVYRSSWREREREGEQEEREMQIVILWKVEVNVENLGAKSIQILKNYFTIFLYIWNNFKMKVFLVLNSILSDINIVTSTFFILMFLHGIFIASFNF